MPKDPKDLKDLKEKKNVKEPELKRSRPASRNLAALDALQRSKKSLDLVSLGKKKQQFSIFNDEIIIETGEETRIKDTENAKLKKKNK